MPAHAADRGGRPRRIEVAPARAGRASSRCSPARRSRTRWSRPCGGAATTSRCCASIGFTRRQTRRRDRVAGDAASRSAGVVVGVPLGIAAGRLVWRWLADDFPIVYVPPLALLAVLSWSSGRDPARERARRRPGPRRRPHPAGGGATGRVTRGGRASGGGRSSVAGGDGDEIGGADLGQTCQLRGHRLLVTDDRDVGRSGDTLMVEHRAVDGDVAVPRELLARLGAAVGFVVGDDRGQRDDDAR